MAVFRKIVFSLVLAALSAMPPSCAGSSTVTTTVATCRSKQLPQPAEPHLFDLHSCAWCYHFLARSPDIMPSRTHPFLLVISNRTSYARGTYLVPDVTNATDVSSVCSTVPTGICERWKECCHEARECCRRQTKSSEYHNGTCPRTWDGWSCFDDTPAGTVEYVECPEFLQYAVLSNPACGNWTPKAR